MKFQFHNMPHAVLPVLKKELEKFGAKVTFLTETSGRVDSIGGQLTFEHADNVLTIEVVKEHGHFPLSMLTGGIRQTVYEARELIEREAIA